MSILEVHDVSIRYMTGDFKDIGLKEYVMRKLRGDYHKNEFWADQNVSFSLEKGDMLGIIGTNGAGKSTLLKAISGIMEPTGGWVKREGNIAALLELSSGFDGDLTVRENTYLRGAMLGYTRKFMEETYDQIIDFAELRNFQDRPFKQLSSGMKSRLAFSIASLVQPDILILDEVLSVGDGAFRNKSAKKMREIIRGGATTILVSHSLDQVRELCNKVLWLHEGQQIEFGNDVDGICDRYQEFLSGNIPSGIKRERSERNTSFVKERATEDQVTASDDLGKSGDMKPALMRCASWIRKLFRLDVSFAKIALWFVLILGICSVGLLLACSIQNENISRNIKISAEKMLEEGTYPRWIPESMRISTYYRIDNWTEAALLNMIYTGNSSTPVQSAFSQKEYRVNNPDPEGGVGHLAATVNGVGPESGKLKLRSTYWLGVRIFLIPLLAITDYYSIRLLQLFLNFTLIFLITLLLSFRVNKKTGIAFFLSILMLNYYTSAVQWCNGFPCLWIVALTLLFVLSKREDRLNYCILFLVVGMLTSYFDWFSVPLVTFGIPVIVILMIDAQKNPVATICAYFNKVFRCAFGWCLGYASMLVGRAAITTFMNGDGSWENFSTRVIYNITSSNAAEEGRLLEKFDTLVKGFRGIFPLPMFEADFANIAMIALVCLMLALVLMFYKKIPVLSILGLVSIAPFVWFWVFNGYCRVHYWIAFRVFSVTVFSWILIFCLILEHIKKTIERRKGPDQIAGSGVEKAADVCGGHIDKTIAVMSKKLPGKKKWIFFGIIEYFALLWALYMEQKNYNLSRLSTGAALFQSICVKCMILGLIAFFYYKIVICIYTMHNKTELRRGILSLIYLIILILAAAFFYQRFNYLGSYAHGDMTTAINRALEYKFLSYQGWYTTILYGVVMQLLPLDLVHYGLVAFQIMIVSYIVGCELDYVYTEYGKRRSILLGCVFLLPPALYFAQFTLRQTWFAFSFVLLITEIDKYLKGKAKKQYALIFLTAFLAVLRPEGKWIIFFMILFISWETYKKSKTKRELLTFVIGAFAAFVVLSAPQKDLNEYKSTPMLNPLSNMLIDPNFQWNNEQHDRETISKVVDVDLLMEHASLYRMEITSVQGAWNKAFTNADFSEFLKVYVRLVLKNMDIFLKVRWKTFALTFSEGRYTISSLIGNNVISKIVAILYNSTIPLIILTLLLLYHRNKKALILWLLVLGEAGIIFVLVTETSYMFHMLFCLGAWVSVVLCLKMEPNQKPASCFPPVKDTRKEPLPR